MLRFAESFEHATTAAQMQTKWSNVAGLSTFYTGRSGGTSKSLGLAHNGGEMHKTFSAGQATWIAGVGFQDSYRCTGHDVVNFLDAGTGQMRVYIGSDGKLGVARGGTGLATGTTILSVGVWYYIEFKATIHPTAGSYELRINGAVELTATGVNTRATANSTADQVRFGEARNVDNTGLQHIWDDLYICDSTGAQNNDFLGDIRVQALFTTADGASSQWTPNSGAVHFDRVSQTTPDDDTTYLSDATAGDIDTWAYGDLASTTGDVKGIQIVPWVRKDDAGIRTVAPVIRIGGVNYVQANLPNLSTSYQYLPQIVELSPATAVAWTVAEINAMEAGIKMVA